MHQGNYPKSAESHLEEEREPRLERAETRDYTRNYKRAPECLPPISLRLAFTQFPFL